MVKETLAIPSICNSADLLSICGRHFQRNGSHVAAPLDEHFDVWPIRFEKLTNPSLKFSRVGERTFVQLVDAVTDFQA